MKSGWISWQFGGVASIEASVVGYFLLSFFFPPSEVSTERFVCVLASVGASLVVWSCSTEMSADLCYSRGIRVSQAPENTSPGLLPTGASRLFPLQLL